MTMLRLSTVVVALVCVSGCAAPQQNAQSSFVPVPLEPPVALEPERLLPSVEGSHPRLFRMSCSPLTMPCPRLMTAGCGSGWKIHSLGPMPAPEADENELIVDGRGAVMTPGLVDTHSHLGVYSSPNVWAHADGNEMTTPSQRCELKMLSGLRIRD